MSDAEKALCWLRGWVKPQTINKELNEMKDYSESSKLKNTAKLTKKSEQLNAVAYMNEVNLDDETNTVKLTIAPDSANATSIKPINNELNRGNTDDNQNRKKHEPVNNTHHEIANWKIKLQDLVRPEMLKPLRLVIGFFLILNLSGITAMRPYFVNIFQELDFPVEPYKATVSNTVVSKIIY